MHILHQENLVIDEQKANEPKPNIRPGQRNETTRHKNRYPPPINTCQTSPLTTSKKS